MNKCGLDAYFFLRYLQTLLVIFVPLACILLPILIPINYIGGRNTTSLTASADEVMSDSSSGASGGLDTLAWGNVLPSQSHRYWAHLVLAVLVVIWVCYVFFAELRVYIRVRQDFLTSPEHRLRASATTMLVTSIPEKWLTVEALSGLYDVFPGGIRNIWINRNYDPLLTKVRERERVVARLEEAETQVIRACKRAQLKQQRKEMKAKAKEEGVRGRVVRKEKAKLAKEADANAAKVALGEGVSSGDPGQIYRTVQEAVEGGIDGADGSLTPRPRSYAGISPRSRKSFATNEDTPSPSLTVDTSLKVDTTLRPTTPHSARSIKDNTTVNGLHTGDRQLEIPRPLQPRDSMFGLSPTTPRSFGERRGMKGPQLEYIPGPMDTKASWWQFWKGPSGGYPSPLPHGYHSEEMHKRNFGEMVANGGSYVIAPVTWLFSKIEGPKHEYPPHCDPDYKDEASEAPLWRKYIKESERPTHRLPRFDLAFLPYIFPWANKKVDSIYWCRERLARLNVEIEHDQAHPECYPTMNSAFIQFNHQVAAHMAAQAVNHHVPRHMSPRIVEISPTDVIWDNMSIKWWEEWLRSGIVITIVVGMCILWAIPVSATTLLGNIPQLVAQYKWLSFLKGAETPLKPVSGVVPAIVLSILMMLPSMIFYKLAFLQGKQTGKQRELSVQNYYFFFLFVQAFLVVSISSGTLATLAEIADVTSIPRLLAQNLPKASNYFFSYMIIQALSVSAGTLLQIGTLLSWLIMPRMADNTPRQKWKRNTSLSQIEWGAYFPTYTNFACIALIYSTISPLIIVFAIITFTVLWIANRYGILYVYKHTEDTGGLLYPRAINQTFVGLYVMELCMIGLFFLVQDENEDYACTPQASIMIVVAALTALFQILLNNSFGPLYEYLPIVAEDDAVIRDEAFERLQATKLNGADNDDGGTASRVNTSLTHEDSTIYPVNTHFTHNTDIELRKLHEPTDPAPPPTSHSYSKYDPRNGILQGASLARTVGAGIFGDPDAGRQHPRRHGDVEAAREKGAALFGGYNDEIEDLTPEERDALVRAAFRHEALRARRPNVWLPRDDLGVSDQEVRAMEGAGRGNVWIANQGTALDSKVRTIFTRNPPDFSEVDLIML